MFDFDRFKIFVDSFFGALILTAELLTGNHAAVGKFDRYVKWVKLLVHWTYQEVQVQVFFLATHFVFVQFGFERATGETVQFST